MPGMDTKFFCSESEGWQDIKDETIIPDWCPLPDDRREK
jgi:hypothetical protein